MPLTDKLKQGWGAPPSEKPAETAAPPKEAAPPPAAPPAPSTAPASAPSPSPATQDNSPAGWLNWLAEKGRPIRDWNRAMEDRFTRGGLDYLFSQLPSPAKSQSGLSTEDFLAQERAKTEAAKAAIGPLGRASADIVGYGMSAPLFNAVGINNPIAQGLISGGVNAVGHGGDIKDIATQSAEEGTAGALSIPLSKYVLNPAINFVRNHPIGPFGSGPPSSVVYPYVKPGQTTEGNQPAQSPTLGGVPGFRDPRYPASMSAEDLGRMARELEAMPKATGEGGDAQNALMEIMKQRLNDVVTKGTPTGATKPGSGLQDVNRAYWAGGGPPSGAGADALTGVQSGMAKAVGAGIGGAAGHMTGIPGGSGAGAVLGAEYGPKALAWLTNPTPTSAYPAFGMRPPTGQQALANLLIGGAPDVDQYLRQQGWPGQ